MVIIAVALAAAVWRPSGNDRHRQPARPLSASVLTEAELPGAAAEPVRRWDPRTTPAAWLGAALLRQTREEQSQGEQALGAD